MNTNMLEHEAVQRNMATLAARGVQFVDPGAGYLACGWIGKGRLAEPEDDRRSGAAAAEPRGLAARPVRRSSPPGRPTRTSTRCATSATVRAARWATPSRPRRRGAARGSCWSPGRRALDAAGRCRARQRAAAPPRCTRRCSATPADADIVIMAAAVADYMPEAARRREDREDRRRRSR